MDKEYIQIIRMNSENKLTFCIIIYIIDGKLQMYEWVVAIKDYINW